jgi:hypothetical protein
MKKFIAAVLFFASVSAFAADKNSVGVTYGLDNNGTFGIQGEFDISSKANGQPISIAVYYKTASQTIYGVTADASALGVTANYDLSKVLKITNDKFRPYAGVGLERTTATAVTPAIPPFIPSMSATASSMDLAYTIGVKYSVSREVDVSASLSSFDGVGFGANYNF